MGRSGVGQGDLRSDDSMELGRLCLSEAKTILLLLPQP